MPAGYVIVDIEIADTEGFKEYSRQVPKTLEPYGGRFLVRGGAHETVEGAYRLKRVVVLEFPDTHAAKAWYASPAYQDILPIRLRHSRAGFFTFVEGYKSAE